MKYYQICDSCETVQHCRAFGCVPLQPLQPQPVAWALYQRDRLLSFWMDKGDAYDFEFTSEHRWEPLYTQPPALQKPLTDDEIEALAKTLEARGDTLRQFARAIEAAHNIRN